MSVAEKLTENLIDTLKNNLSSEITGQLGKFLGESGNGITSALESAIPAVFAGVAQKGSTLEGATKIFNAINNNEITTDIPSIFSKVLSGGQNNPLMGMASNILREIFGTKLDSITSVISSVSGVRSASASNILQMAVPLILGVLKNKVIGNNLNPSALMGLLGGQKDFLSSMIDKRLLGALGVSNASALFSNNSNSATVTNIPKNITNKPSQNYSSIKASTSQTPSFLKWLPLALLLGALAWWMSSRTAQDTQVEIARKQATESIDKAMDSVKTAQNAAQAAGANAANAIAGAISGAVTDTKEATDSLARAAADAANKAGNVVDKAVDNAGAKVTAAIAKLKSLSLPDGSSLANIIEGGLVDNLATFLSISPVGTEKEFRLEGVNFETASNRLTQDSIVTLDQLAAVLKAYPTATVKVQGFTDNVGDPTANLKLSSDRASVVSSALNTRGISTARITAEGFGEKNPVATNDTEEGRAMNRRVDAVVTKR